MRKALGWYVRKALFFLMASQNIPSQSCTHLLRILLVMVVVVVIKEVEIWCSFQGLLDIPGCWIIATCKVWVAIRPSKLFLCFVCWPASSIQAPPSSAFVKLLCLCLWTQGWVFSGPYWCPKLGLLGPNWVPNCVLLGQSGVQTGVQTAFCSANLVSRFVYWVKLVSKVWTEYSKPY